MGPDDRARWIDITRPLDPERLVVWPGDPPLELRRIAEPDPGTGGARVTAASLSLHAGTHIDAPCHYLPGGASVESIPLEALMGPARVIRHAPDRHLEARDLADAGLEGVERLLIATTNESRNRLPGFQADYVALHPDAARWIASRMRLVGIDYLSIGPPGPEGEEVHRALLGAGVAVLEGLLLDGLEEGDYELAALPLPVVGSDGAPARAVVRRLSGSQR